MSDNVNELLIANKIADNVFRASHIATGLKLWECKNNIEILKRAQLYRKWRPKTDIKNDIPSWQAYELAIAGIDPDDVEPRQIDMFEVKQ